MFSGANGVSEADDLLLIPKYLRELGRINFSASKCWFSGSKRCWLETKGLCHSH